jgi:hypothetical protein
MRHEPAPVDIPVWVGDELQSLPTETRNRLRSRLANPRSAEATANELRVYGILRGHGLVPTYEADLAGRTPDLTALVEDTPVFIEVWTRSTNTALDRERARWHDLRQRVHTIPTGLHLGVQGISDARLEPPHAAEAKRIVGYLRRELLRTTTGVGAVIPIGQYRFHVVAHNDAMHVTLRTPTGGAVTDSDTLRTNIRAKATRYGDRVTRLDGVLVVVIACSREGTFERSLVASALRGEQSVSMTIDPLASGFVAEYSTQLNATNVPASFHPSLSAVGWLTTGPESGLGSLSLLEIEDCRHPVPGGLRAFLDPAWR